MGTTTKQKKRTTTEWHDEDRQAFADRNFLKAQTIPNKKRIARRKACRDKSRWE
jgi:hypothetical protein